MGTDVAVYLIFQPNGLSASTIRTCDHLSQNGYSVVLVSNGSVSEDDRSRVIPHISELIERPNFGYDFGGYQQGILQILNSGQDLQNLLILNDSVWFPIFENSDLLDRMRDDPAQVTGPIIYRHRTPRRTHLQSYLMNFDRAVVESQAFRKFWESYSQTNNKLQTIRRGEMGLSGALRDAGFTLKAMFDQDQIIEAFWNLSSEELRSVYTYEAARNPIFRSKIQNLLTTHTDVSKWREAALELLDEPGWRQYFLTNHPTVSVSKVGFPILKKDKGFEYRLQRKMLLESWRSDDLESINPIVLEEIRSNV